VINVFLDTAGKTAYETLLQQQEKVSERVLSQFDHHTQELVIAHMHVLAAALNNA
jgi:hypothetical protein